MEELQDKLHIDVLKQIETADIKDLPLILFILEGTKYEIFARNRIAGNRFKKFADYCPSFV